MSVPGCRSPARNICARFTGTTGKAPATVRADHAGADELGQVALLRAQLGGVVGEVVGRPRRVHGPQLHLKYLAGAAEAPDAVSWRGRRESADDPHASLQDLHGAKLVPGTAKGRIGQVVRRLIPRLRDRVRQPSPSFAGIVLG